MDVEQSTCEPATIESSHDVSEASLSSEVGEAFQDMVPGPRNLRSKCIMAMGRHLDEDFGPSPTKHVGKWTV